MAIRVSGLKIDRRLNHGMWGRLGCLVTTSSYCDRRPIDPLAGSSASKRRLAT